MTGLSLGLVFRNTNWFKNKNKKSRPLQPPRVARAPHAHRARPMTYPCRPLQASQPRFLHSQTIAKPDCPLPGPHRRIPHPRQRLHTAAANDIQILVLIRALALPCLAPASGGTLGSTAVPVHNLLTFVLKLNTPDCHRIIFPWVQRRNRVGSCAKKNCARPLCVTRESKYGLPLDFLTRVH
jgi:hypothetical protein